ncbi:MAG: response regulator, partial [Waterburya sp.]
KNKVFLYSTKVIMFKQCILVIDDSDGFINFIQSTFDSCTDWQVLTASDEKKAIALAQLEQPDIIMLNLKMPEPGELDPLNTYHLLKSDQTISSIPVVFIMIVPGIEKAKLLYLNDPEIITQLFDHLKFSGQATKTQDRLKSYNSQ